MDDRTDSIYRGPAEAFLICDMQFKDINPPFVTWLRDEGFRCGSHHGNYGNCPWLHVDITDRLYAYGLPGNKLVEPIGGHAVTVEEFRIIYAIYKKYEGKGPFVFHSERFDYDR